MSDMKVLISTNILPVEIKDIPSIMKGDKGDPGRDGSFVQKAYKSYASMVADKGNIPTNTSVLVNNDPDKVKNAYYTYDGSEFTKSDFDPQGILTTVDVRLNQAVESASDYFQSQIEDTVATVIDNSTVAYTDAIEVTKDIVVADAKAATKSALDTAVTDLFDNGGLPATPFKDFNSMTASALGDGSYAVVTDSPQESYNGLYRKESGAWVLSNYNLKSNLEEHIRTTVSELENEFLTVSPNLFDARKATEGKVISATGVIETNASYSVSDYIAVETSTQYTISGGNDFDAFKTAVQYDVNKNFINRIDVGNNASPNQARTVTTASSAAFIRLNLNAGKASENNRMFNKGAVALPYAEGGNTLKALNLSPDFIERVNKSIIIDEQNISFISSSKNLFNMYDVTLGRVIGSDGIIVDNADYATSNFIKVEPLSSYTISGIAGKDAFSYTSYYDKDKVFILRASTKNSVSEGYARVITIPANTEYVRLSMNQGLPTENKRMFNEGSVALPYESGGTKLKDVLLSEPIMQQISNELEISNSGGSNSYIIDVPVDAVFSTNQVWDGYTGWRQSKTAAQVYAMYDALQAQHPDYITKTVMGNDAQGNPIAVYNFKPYISRSSSGARPLPKIFLICGAHGHEHMPPLTTYLMLEQMCNNWQSDGLLEALRFNVHFMIIPIANPSGWNNYTRKTAQGIDIARSFPENFGWESTEPSSSFYGGEYPLQAVEAQYISHLLTNNPDIDACYDFHNFGGTSAETHPHYIWIANGAGKPVAYLGQALMGRMTRKFKKDHAFIPDGWTAGYDTNRSGAMIQDHAFAKGVKYTSTFEIGEKWWITDTIDVYDATHLKTSVEVLTNWMLLNVQAVSGQI